MAHFTATIIALMKTGHARARTECDKPSVSPNKFVRRLVIHFKREKNHSEHVNEFFAHIEITELSARSFYSSCTMTHQLIRILCAFTSRLLGSN